MKKFLFFVSFFGLMSVLSSCNDSFIMDEEKSFTPIMYEAKAPEILGEEATILLIKGIEDLVFDEIEKTDWKIITKYRVAFRGSQPLQIDIDKTYEIDSDIMIRIPTNYEDVLVTFDRLKVMYNYLGEDRELLPEDGLKLLIDVEELQRDNEPIFVQTGNIVFRLCVGALPVKIHKLPFAIYSTDEEIKKWIEEQEKKQNESQNQ